MSLEWRHFVNDEVQASDAATYRLELPNRGSLHTILLKARCTNGSSHGRNVSMLDVIDSIQVIGDGSEVIYSLKPVELEKWYETMYGRGLNMVQDEQADAVQEIVLPIMFGRELYDSNYFLPLERFKDVKLEVTYSPNIAASAGFAAGTTSFDVMLGLSREGSQLVYEGTLKTRRLNSFTSTASGEAEIELPNALNIRAIGVYAYEAGIEDGVDVTKVVLEDKATGMKVFEADWDDFLNVNQELFGSTLEHNIIALLNDTATLNTRIGNIQKVAIAQELDTNITLNTISFTRHDTIAGDLITFNKSLGDFSAGAEDLTAYTTVHKTMVTVKGNSPSFFGLIPFLYNDNRAGYLDTTTLGRPTVILSQGGAGAEVNVSIQELKNY